MTHEADLPPGDDDTSQDEAAAWFARLRADDGRSYRKAFEHWRAASPDHATAFDRIEQIFEQSAVLLRSRRYGLELPEPVRSGIRGRPQLLALAAAAVLSIVMGLSFLVHRQATKQRQTAVALVDEPLLTRRGQIRQFQLPDGTTLTLDTASRARVVMDNSERRVQLEAGKARFAVAADSRPFIVEAGAGRVAARTGVFDVAYGSDDEIAVTLIEGSAEVMPVMRHADLVLQVAPLLRGKVYNYGATHFGAARAFTPSAAEDTSDWPIGWIEYRSVPLHRLVADANRYASKPIVIDDADAADLAASGRFHLTDSAGFASRLAEVFDLKVTRAPDGIHLGQPIKNLRSP